MKFLEKTSTDAKERESLLADPRSYLIADGFEVPDSVKVTAVEIQGSHPTLEIGVPPMLNLDELSDAALSNVSGGDSGNIAV